MAREPDPGPPVEGPPISTLIVRLGLALVALLAFVLTLGFTLRVPLEAASMFFVDRFGLVGVFVAVLVLDAIPFTTHEPILFFGHSGGLGYWPVFATASAASVLSGPLGWAIGRLGRRADFLQRVLLRYRITPFLRRYGVWAVAVAAITPFPFAVCTWGSGAAGVPLRHVLVGSLVRIPKVFLFLSLIVLGWRIGT